MHEFKEVENLAVVIPCYNEESTISKVINDFKKFLPNASIYVINNNSTDRTPEIAKEKGATVINEKRQGKGFSVVRMFESIRADFYVMVDGDDTYPADSVYELLKPVINEQADMVVGARLETYTKKAFRSFHVLGNNMIKFLVNKIFRCNLKDVMSGYRAFNIKVINHLPLVAAGFDIETEMTLQCLYYNYIIKEIDISYKERPEGSYSKLNTIRDGLLVLKKIFSLFRAYKPLTFFGILGLLAFILGLFFGSFPIYEYFTSGFIERVPLAILATGFILVGIIFFNIGIILHTVNYRLKELFSVLRRLEK